MCNDTIGLYGSGMLHAAIRHALAGQVEIVPVSADDLAGALPPCRVLVSSSDAWDIEVRRAAQTACATAEVPWLPVWTELGRVLVGPATRPGIPGCANCVELRRDRARARPAEDKAVWQRHAGALISTPSSWLTGLACATVAALVAEQVLWLLDRPAAARTENAMVQVDLADITVATHGFLPDPMCPVCGALPADTAERARLVLRRRPKPRPGVYRTRSVTDEYEDLVRTYVDPEVGLVRAVETGTEAGLAVAAAPMGLRADGAVELSWGRSDNYRTSELTAILESLERWGGMQPGGKRTTMRASYAKVREDAVDPRLFGLYPPERHGPSFPFVAFDDDLELNWVWGYSFRRREPILVPESYAYYGMQRINPEQPRFVFETSNGCALGSCLEEAILHGILEIAERDAFLMTWYASMAVPQIDLSSARDRTIPLLRRRIEDESGWRISAFDTTVEQRVPCVWVMAVNERDDPDAAKTVCTGGSHLHPEQAVRNALFELGPVLGSVSLSYAENADRVRRMVDDPSLVRHMADHSLLYASPLVLDRFGFLFDSGGRRTLAEMAATSRPARHLDLRDDLVDLVQRYLDTGLDVIVVDQTTPEHKAGGFCCAKTIIPGTLPMTFGDHARRVHGLPRLHRIPHLLGYRDAPLDPAEINPHPHPFP